MKGENKVLKEENSLLKQAIDMLRPSNGKYVSHIFILNN